MTRPLSAEETIDACVSQLHGAIEERVKSLATDLRASARAECEAAVQEVRVRAEAELSSVRAAEAQRTAEAEHQLHAKIAQVRVEMREENERERARLQKEFEESMVGQLTEALADAAKAHAAELARVRAQASQAAVFEAGKARSEAEREFAAEMARVRAEAQQAIAAQGATASAEPQKSGRRRERADASAMSVPDLPGPGGRQPVFLGIALVRSVRALEEAANATEILDRLAGALADEAGRSVLLILRGVEAEVWRITGFGAGVDCGRRMLEAGEIDTTGPGSIVQAIERSEPCYARTSPSGAVERSGLRFAELPEGKVGLAVPLLVNAQVVAVVYADEVVEDGRTIAPAWPEFVEVLTRHAARCLEALSRSSLKAGLVIPPLPTAQQAAPRR